MSTTIPASMERSNKRIAVNDEPQEKQLVTISKKAKNEENYVEVNDKSQVNVFHLNSDVWRLIFQLMPISDVVTLSSVCKQFQHIVQNTYYSYNLSKDYRLDVDCFLNYSLSSTCSSIDINYCSRLTPSTINEMISKTNLHHLHLIQCQVNEDCVRSICNLQLQSLSFTYTDEWRSYFIQNAQQCLLFFQNLNTLKIEFSNSICSSLDLKSKALIFDIFENCLQYCKELQHLKLFDDFIKFKPPGKSEISEFPSQTTPLLKLTSLEISVHPILYNKDVLNFLKALLQDKVIPLKNVDLGDLTCDLLKDGILRHPLIVPSRNFILRQYHWCSQVDEDYYENYENKISNWLSQTDYESVFVNHLKFKNFATFAEKMISASGKSIRKLYICDCLFFENIGKGLELFAIHCPQITVLHLTINKGRSKTILSCYNHDQRIKNEVIIEALSNFKNLKELVISAIILQCKYYNLGGAQWIKVMPFWRVTKSCEQLNKMRIINEDISFAPPAIHVDSINDIVHCKNLRVLQFENFGIFGNENFRLSEITENCTKLEHLRISNIVNDNIYVGNYILKLEDSLCKAKQLKILRVDYGRRYLTKTFLNSLCFCEKLEKIRFCLRGGYFVHKIEITNLIEVLSKLKNLFVFKIELYDTDGDSLIIKQLNSLFEKIKKDRPTFFGSTVFVNIHDQSEWT